MSDATFSRSLSVSDPGLGLGLGLNMAYDGVEALGPASGFHGR
jgi:hypothetical protein